MVCLIPARTDTTYWHDYIFNNACEIRFIRIRIKFGDSKTDAPFPSAIVIFNHKNASETPYVTTKEFKKLSRKTK